MVQAPNGNSSSSGRMPQRSVSAGTRMHLTGSPVPLPRSCSADRRAAPLVFHSPQASIKVVRSETAPAAQFATSPAVADGFPVSQRCMTMPVEDWSEHDVACWLVQSAKPPQDLVDVLRKHAVDGSILHRRLLSLAASELQALCSH